MMLLEAEKERYKFRISRIEKAVLLALLRKYPLVPLSHHKLTAGHVQADAAAQTLLEDAMSARRAEVKSRIRQFVDDSERFVPETTHLRLSLHRDELEWLLQVLNDIRVGSWIRLGCPDPDTNTPSSSVPESELLQSDMELAAYFECRLLEAVDGPRA